MYFLDKIQIFEQCITWDRINAAVVFDVDEAKREQPKY